MPAPRRLAFLGGAVCRAAAADAPLDPGAVRQALATVALGAFVLGTGETDQRRQRSFLHNLKAVFRV